MKKINYNDFNKRLNNIFEKIGTSENGGIIIIYTDPKTNKTTVEYSEKDERIKKEFDTEEQAEKEIKKINCRHVLKIEII